MIKIRFKQSIVFWDTPEFNKLLKKEISQLSGKQLPLQKGLSFSSVALDDKLDVVLLNIRGVGSEIQVKAGIFYSGIISGCSCSDDPSPTDIQNEYCEMLFKIDKLTGDASVELLIEPE